MDTSKLILAQNLMDCVGKLENARAWYRLLPILTSLGDNYRYHLPTGSLLLEKYRGMPIRAMPWETKKPYWSGWQNIAIFRLLTRDIGLGVRVARRLVNKRRTHLLRIEDFISGMVDSLWLADEKIFLSGGHQYLTIKKLVRKIFAVGTHNLSVLVDDWKEWGTYLFHTVSGTITIGPLVPPKYNNIFKALNKLDCVSSLLAGDRSMLRLQQLAHLISSRQMPYMGSETEKKSVDKFREVLESDFEPAPEVLEDLGNAARRIGGICKSIRKYPIPERSSHISVTSSGERDYPASKGAQAAAVRDALVRILTRVPEQDEMENTPFGPVNHKAGVQIWKTLFRGEDDVYYNSSMQYLERVLEGIPKESAERFAGLDRVTGKQLMYVAWKELSPPPIVLRASVCPEMGNKARMVTLSPYWVNVIQAPLAHLLVDALKLHPSAFSSFARQDQAWDACRGLIRLSDISLDHDQAVLSSDLSDATNTQCQKLTIVMLRAFIEGFTGSNKMSEYVELALGTIGPRIVTLPGWTTVLSKTGVMMGEAIAKPSLTLLNLAIEEASFLKYINKREMLYGDRKSPKRAWRFFHVGGDDHLAKGPVPYLNLITDYHLKAGSHIKPGQHGYSRLCVRYCERLINLENLQHRVLFDGKRGEYTNSTIVDSVKVRLLERGLSTLLLKDNKNVAIGKSAQLVKVLQWLPIDGHHYTWDKIVSIRNLFINRMGPLLPSKDLHPRAHAAVHLPKIFGGYGLGFEHEYLSIFALCPDPHKWLLSKGLVGMDITEDLEIFRKLSSNVSHRGIDDSLMLKTRLKEYFRKYPEAFSHMSWHEVSQKWGQHDMGNRITLDTARRNGFIPLDDYLDWTFRGNIFQDLILGQGGLKIFNTRPFTRTYQKVWDECEENGLDQYGMPQPHSNRDILSLINKLVPQYFINTNVDGVVDVGFQGDESREEEYDIVERPIKEIFTMHLPDLVIGKALVGCDRF